MASSIPPRVGPVLLEHLHDDAGPAPVREQRVARVVEVGVRVPARRHLLDREDRRPPGRDGAWAASESPCPLELQARVERGLGDLDLLGRRLGGRDSGSWSSGRARPAHARADGRGAASSSRRPPSRQRKHPARRRATRGRAEAGGARATRVLAPTAGGRGSAARRGGAAALVLLLRSPRRARTCRWRCAPRRGRPRARRHGGRSAAGASEITPLASSCTAGERRSDSRIARAASRRAAMAASTFLRSKGIARLGQRVLHARQDEHRLEQPGRAAQKRQVPGRRTRAASARRPPSAPRTGCAPRTPTRSGRGRGRRWPAPCLRDEPSAHPSPPA